VTARWTVTFLPSHGTVAVADGTTILEAARAAGLMVQSPCNGAGVCGKCRVTLANGEAANACRTQLFADASVELPVPAREDSLKILEQGVGVDVPLAPRVRVRYGPREDRTIVEAGERILASERGDVPLAAFGAVADIGTTTLVVSLVDLRTGLERASAAAINPQARHAQDVLSRISFAAEPGGLERLRAAVVEALDALAGEVAAAAGVRRSEIYEIVFSGNTCMLHLATGTDPASLGKVPYASALELPALIDAREHGLALAEGAAVFLPPVISGFVGADITAGILAARLDALAGVSLFIDIGTNGEMVLAVDGALTATSTAAGPAFEGMNISCGMRAARGAIETVEIDAAGNVSLGVIGDAEPAGLCGSGLLDAAGALVARGVVDRAGRLRKAGDLPPALAERIVERDGKAAFALAPRVSLTQRDIRHVQLAKGAIRSGVDALLTRAGVGYEAVDRVFIAGSFGYHVRPESLFRLGLLPRAFAERITFLGNTSKTGGHALLVNEAARVHMGSVVRRAGALDLAAFPGFEKIFVRSLGFAEAPVATPVPPVHRRLEYA
jgi:uncharacterized 2Fe-2S/4Fe-4S cluster protein (DUF4445 family)